ncbi:hypothetical protein QIK94_gp1 [ssRNA phage SRR6960803_12]|uniref:Uncharacterized protein n=1 Tax=ssRNA phage SRR6960803_12 TaxID=2786615 RepID=A0A8S5KY81_9VIRU|nr:hypothetical protein QIK94_gp1 [ssRNA phage SRR6960803_12]DAD50734.1 TPA_asm: hypothetical protein [ssRNA phage SRR6960803_12]
MLTWRLWPVGVTITIVSLPDNLLDRIEIDVYLFGRRHAFWTGMVKGLSMMVSVGFEDSQVIYDRNLPSLCQKGSGPSISRS